MRDKWKKNTELKMRKIRVYAEKKKGKISPAK
jgi:hypothetical protein